MREKVKNLATSIGSKFLYVATLCFVLSGTVLPVYADVTSGAKTASQKIEKTILAISVPVAGACIAVCFFMMMITKDERKSATWKDWLIRIAICFVAINCVGLAIDFLQDIAKDFQN